MTRGITEDGMTHGITAGDTVHGMDIRLIIADGTAVGIRIIITTDITILQADMKVTADGMA